MKEDNLEEYIDQLLYETKEDQSYFDDLEDLEDNAEESWARIEQDVTMARVLGLNYGEFEELFEYGDE